MIKKFFNTTVNQDHKASLLKKEAEKSNVMCCKTSWYSG